MKQVRQGVFETNSSSTHSICIAEDTELIIPEFLHFQSGEFGWEHNTLSSAEEKASYLSTGLFANERDSDFIDIVEYLKEQNINITFDSRREFDNGYVDHSYDLKDFLDAVCNDKNQLMRFLFSPLSFIMTGNDNSEIDVEIKVDYPHTAYHKDN